MTDDEIELPPLPKPDAQYITHTDFSLLNYGRKCYEAGLAAARAEQAQPAKPKVHSVALSLGPDNSWSCYAWAVHPALATITLCWTDDGRAWIESKRNRELAARLRSYADSDEDGLAVKDFETAADALDGGAR